MKILTEAEEEKTELMGCGYRRSEYQTLFCGEWWFEGPSAPEMHRTGAEAKRRTRNERGQKDEEPGAL